MHIEVTDSQNSKRTYTFDKPKILIGRSKDADLRLESDEISRKHLYLEIENSKFYVEDLGSPNGVYINGEKLASNARTEIQTFFPLQIGTDIYIQILEEPSADIPAPRPRPAASADRSSTNVIRQKPAGGDRTVTRVVGAPSKKRAPESKKASSKNSMLLLLILAGGGYYAYTNYIAIEDTPEVTQENTAPKVATPAQVLKAEQNVQLTPLQIYQRDLSESELSKLCQKEGEKTLCERLDPPLEAGEGVILDRNVARVYRNVSELQKSSWGGSFERIEKPLRYEFILSYLVIKAMMLPEVSNQGIKKIELVDFKRLSPGEVIIRSKVIINHLSALMIKPEDTMNELENIKSTGEMKTYDEKIKKGHVISYYISPEDLLKE